MANKIVIKRTTTSGLLPNTTNSANTSYIAGGELAINLTDKKLLSSNGSTTFEIGANLSSISVGGVAALGNTTVTGFITATGDITAFFSDDRLKDRKGNIPFALDKVNQLNGFYYSPNEIAKDYGYEDKIYVGVSAQEVLLTVPEAIAPAPIDPQYMTVKYEKLIPLLIEAIKEQQKQIDELKALVSKD